MRKRSYCPISPHAATLASLFLVLTACRGGAADARSESTSTIASSAVIGVAPPDMSHARESAAVAPAASPAPTSEAPAPEQPAHFALGDGNFSTGVDMAGAMLIRQGEGTIEVHRLSDALTKVRQTAAQFGGFVANTALHNGKNEQPSATLELRVPSAQFDGLLAALGGIGKVESVTANAQDVGEEFVDIGARAANARRVEARLVEMLGSRTGKLSEVLTVEQELARVREQIERYDARLRFLERRTAMSSLTITLHEPLALIDRPSPGPLVEALALAWQRTLGVIAWCIASLGLIVPVAILIGLGVVVIRRFEWPRYHPE